MTDDELLRYSRHILLNEVGVEGQQRFQDSHALVIGAGGLGSAGVGQITVVDHDTVDLTNLQRQIAHTTARVGLPKVESLARAIHAINPEVQVHGQALRANAETLNDWVARADVVLDCSDNFATRHLVNASCVRHGRPLVSGAAIRFDAQVSVYDPRDAESPCYACLFPAAEQFEETRCATLGVFAPLVGIVGAMQAAEALKLLGHMGEPLTGRLMMLDALHMEWNTIRVARHPHCPVCAGAARTACEAS